MFKSIKKLSKLVVPVLAYINPIPKSMKQEDKPPNKNKLDQLKLKLQNFYKQ